MPLNFLLKLIWLLLLNTFSLISFAQNSLPIVIQNNQIYTQVRVNGCGPYSFRLDFNTPGLGKINRRLAKELGLNVVGFEQSSVADQTKREFLVGISKLSLGQITHTDLKLPVSDESTVSALDLMGGTLGQDFFAKYHITIDGPNRQLLIVRDSLRLQTKNVIRYTRNFLVPGKIGSKEFVVHLDIGSNLPLLFPKSALAGIHYVDVANQQTVILAGTTFTIQEAILLDEFVIGQVKLKEQHVFYSDRIHQINLGTNFLKDHIISFDQRAKLVSLE